MAISQRLFFMRQVKTSKSIIESGPNLPPSTLLVCIQFSIGIYEGP
jgi:hypothetical protein